MNTIKKVTTPLLNLLEIATHRNLPCTVSFKRTFFQSSSSFQQHIDLFQDQTWKTQSQQPQNLPVFMRSKDHRDNTAVVDQHGTHTYNAIQAITCRVADRILGQIYKQDLLLGKDRICFLCPNDVSYVVALWSIWLCGGVAVPLCTTHPTSELQYFIEDSQCSLVIYTIEFKEKLKPLMKRQNIPFLMLKNADFFPGKSLLKRKGSNKLMRPLRQQEFRCLVEDQSLMNREALIMYTSGTTGRPKGVVHTHSSITTHIQGMLSAWEWTHNDNILHVLPLHHVHGLINALLTPLYVGATCHMMTKFNAQQVWTQLLTYAGDSVHDRISVFMAVPTIYAKLIQFYDEAVEGKASILSKDFIKTICSTRIRLMVSGSAALPAPIMSRWEEITGHRLLERYGMTETGMVLTNSISGPRLTGSVGNPFPKVEVCISKPNTYTPNGYDEICSGSNRGTSVKPGMENEQGELLVKGPNLFSHYWNRPEDTKKEFTPDGWFKTGDTAEYRDGVYKILGRTSVDIIKSGGFKISALDIERHLLSHPDITDVAVVGLPDITWGQRVAAIVVTAGGKSLSLEDIRQFCQDKIGVYQMPSKLKVLENMPRNAMGKVNKKELVAQVFPNELKGAF